MNTKIFFFSKQTESLILEIEFFENSAVFYPYQSITKFSTLADFHSQEEFYYDEDLEKTLFFLLSHPRLVHTIHSIENPSLCYLRDMK